MTERIIAACDGASKGNPGRAAWAWVIADAEGDPGPWAAGPLGTTTNNVAELSALRHLLEATDPAVPMQVRMDSQYAMKAVTTWLPGWKKKGWRTASGSPVANRELVEGIDRLLVGRAVEFVYVAAHQVDGDRLNDFADRAASQAATSQLAAGSAQGSAAPPPAAARPAKAAKAAKPSKAANSTRRRTSKGEITAKFPGRCRCGRSYAASEPIARNAQGWGHPACRDVESEAAGRSS
ncbi:ribonuclease H family protein [Streptomyces millisiae]|uniref:Ribonuclease H n=1 Tax=Streptomyces millisiae TaxID=3075542 RepID=A0ABU2LH12_9ACTN|nr:ribonuclease H [Streptomyces sp. DSM 44918]MDT0316868.1 ribonuclease H [Streptomyces sp. DSM 44918]